MPDRAPPPHTARAPGPDEGGRAGARASPPREKPPADGAGKGSEEPAPHRRSGGDRGSGGGGSARMIEEVKGAPPLDCNIEGLTINSPRADKDPYMGADHMLEKVKEKMDDAKRNHRSSLKLRDWGRYKFYKSYDDLQRGHVARIKQINARHMEYVKNGEALPGNQVVGGVDRVHWRDLSVEDFVEKYQKPEIPVIITGLTDSWLAQKNWKLEELFSGKYRNCRLKVGEDDEGYSIRIKLKYFLNYMMHQKDDSPMYLFDCSFDEKETESELLRDYEVPKYFSDDLFNLISEKRRPPYRWFLIGPKRSGTSAHIDPLATSAWNALVYGRKRWLLTKPGTRKRHVKGYKLRRRGEDGEAATYFSYVVPRILEEEAKKEIRDLGIREVIQEPGEVIYVPGGWYHAVLNITHTVAVTQNFCARAQFLKIWRHVRKGRKKMAVKWLEALRIYQPDLHQAAVKANDEDGWDMEAIKSKKKKKKKKRKKRSRSSSQEERVSDSRIEHKRKDLLVESGSKRPKMDVQC